MPKIKLKKKQTLLRRTSWLLLILIIILTIVLTSFLLSAQIGLSARQQNTSSTNKLKTIEYELSELEKEQTEMRYTCDDLYLSKAKSLAFLIKNGWVYDSVKLCDMASVMECENLYIIDSEGETLCAAYDDGTDFTRSRFNQLQSAFYDDMEPFSITRDDTTYRYCSARIDDNTLAVVMVDSFISDFLIGSDSTLDTALENVSIGLNGFAFAISRLDYTFSYHPDINLDKTNALSHGVTSEAFADDFVGLIDIDNITYYCVGKLIGDNYIYCAVTVDELIVSAIVLVAAMLIAFLIVVLLISGYAIEISDEVIRDNRLREDNRNSKAYRKALRKRFNHSLRPVAVLGLIGVLVLTYYLQTLFALSRQSVSNTARSSDAIWELDYYQSLTDYSQLWYTEQYMTKCKTAAYILAETETSVQTQEFMRNLADQLDVINVYHFNINGTVISASNDLWDFKLSEDPEDQSYAFRAILDGTTLELAQETLKSDSTGEEAQYIGCAIKNEAHHVIGMAQLELMPKQLETLRARSSTASILSTMHYGMNTFVFAINKEDGKFVYFPNESLIGTSATEAGFKESELTNNVTGFITIDKTEYFFKSAENETLYLYVATPMSSITRTRMIMTLINGGAVCLVIVLILLFMEFVVIRRVAHVRKGADDSDAMIEVSLDNDRVVKTRSTRSRWSFFTVPWEKMSATQRIIIIIRRLIMIFAAAVSLSMIFADRLFDSDSMILYIISGNWEHNINIFAITKCLLIAIIIFTVSMVCHTILRWLSEVTNARGMTTCRMLDNFLRFGCVLALIYIDLGLLGVDTATMLASAGIFSLVIGLGAQSLISDIIAGLFIVFDGEFQVGDIITVEDFRGTVLEIGIRTVKVRADDGNVKIFSNRNVSSVLNMTQELSVVKCRISTEYGDDLTVIEDILNRELPSVASRIPQLKDGPTYVGVVELAASSVDLLIIAHCAEGDRFVVERALNREIKLIFDRNGINIPFPQIVLNEREKAKPQEPDTKEGI